MHSKKTNHQDVTVCEIKNWDVFFIAGGDRYMRRGAWTFSMNENEIKIES